MTVERIVEAAPGGLAVSRALDPSLKRRLLLRAETRELPCVRGRTIVPDACDKTVVIGYPNYLGVFDPARGDSTIALTAAWSQLRPPPNRVTVIAAHEAVPRTEASRALAQVRRMAKHIRQLKGVQLAIRVQSPVIIALLPFSPGTHLLAVSGVTALQGSFPEYPGGIRIEPPAATAGFDLTRYAANVEQLILEEA